MTRRKLASRRDRKKKDRSPASSGTRLFLCEAPQLRIMIRQLAESNPQGLAGAGLFLCEAPQLRIMSEANNPPSATK